MSDRRRIRVDGDEGDDHTLVQLMRAIMRGDFEGTVEFYSERLREWQPVVGIMNDFDYTSAEQLDRIRKAGIFNVRILTSGEGIDCPICTANAALIWPIDAAPSIPPLGCTCKPWCRCIYIAAERSP
jgi:hypothetical protein